MRTALVRPATTNRPQPSSRHGSIIVLSMTVLVMVMAFVAFTVDLGYIALTKSQLQNAADAAALAAGLELRDGLGMNPTASPEKILSVAKQAAQDVAGLHRAGDKDSVLLRRWRDVHLGQVVWDANNDRWALDWGAEPYNMVYVTLHRGTSPTRNGGDGPLPLFFAPVIGHNGAKVQVAAAAGMVPGSGFKLGPGSPGTAAILPFTVHEDAWNDLLDGIGTDEFSYDPNTGTVIPGPDGVLEVNMFPEQGDANDNGNGNQNGGGNGYTPGNFGTVDIGNPNNSTSDRIRQIEFGLNADDLSYYGGELNLDKTPMYLNGDTGVSAAMTSALETIIGKPRAMPIFTEVYGNGNNAEYKVIRFVGIRILSVELTGNPKRIVIQPATLIDPAVIPSKKPTPLTETTIFAPIMLIR